MRAGFAFFLIGSVVGIPALLGTVTSCQLQGKCDPSTYIFDNNLKYTSDGVHFPPPPLAGVVDSTTWESGPIDKAWLDYPGERSIVLDPNLDGAFPGPYTGVSVWVSPDQDANDSNWALASGNLAEISINYRGSSTYNDQHTTVTVTNASCAPYYVRVVVNRADPATASASNDGGALADAGVTTSTDGATAADASDSSATDAGLDATAGASL